MGEFYRKRSGENRIMANEQNLIPNEKRTPSERRANARKAGIASGQARRQNKTMKEIALMLLNTKVPNNKYTEEILNLFPDMDAQDLQYQTAILVSQIQKAVFDKDSKAAEYVRDTSGQKPVEQQILGFDQMGELILDLGEPPKDEDD